MKANRAFLAIGGFFTAMFAGYLLLRPSAPPIPPADLVVSDLIISPLVVYPGETVTISVVVTNIGGEKGTATITRIVEGAMATKEVTLNPGESKVVNFIVAPTSVGPYGVAVDGLSGSFEVIPALVAEFVVSDLIIEPAQVQVGEPVTVSVVVTNIGEARGTCSVTLEVT